MSIQRATKELDWIKKNIINSAFTMSPPDATWVLWRTAFLRLWGRTNANRVGDAQTERQALNPNKEDEEERISLSRKLSLAKGAMGESTKEEGEKEKKENEEKEEEMDGRNICVVFFM